jgi:hypothetical protein
LANWSLPKEEAATAVVDDAGCGCLDCCDDDCLCCCCCEAVKSNF